MWWILSMDQLLKHKIKVIFAIQTSTIFFLEKQKIWWEEERRWSIEEDEGMDELIVSQILWNVSS